MSIIRFRTPLLLAGILLGLAAAAVPGPAAAAPRGPAGPAGQDCPETRAQLAGQRFTSAKELPDLTCADLQGAVLDGLDLTQKIMDGADLRGASLRNAKLGQAHLSHADLRGAHFERAGLIQARLDGADARGAQFDGVRLIQAHLEGADLRGADLIGTDLSQAYLNDADLRGAKIYFLDSTQADTGGARVDVTDPANLQLALLGIVAGLLMLARTTYLVVRGRAAGHGLRRGITRLVVFAAAAALAWFVGDQAAPVLFIVAWYPLLIGAALALLSGLLHGGRAGPQAQGHLLMRPQAPTAAS